MLCPRCPTLAMSVSGGNSVDPLIMKLERVLVKTCDHFKGAQEPACFSWRRDQYTIAEILDRWYEGYMDATRMPLRYYKVKTVEGDTFVLRYHELFDAWCLLVPVEEEPEA